MNRILLLLVVTLFFLNGNAQEPNDCVNAITVCGNGTFMSNATGSGNDFEVNSCGGFEHNSLWLEVNIVQGGTLGFDLIPEDVDILVDYDFWVYGPNRVCSNLGSPIRCATTNPNEAGLPNNHTGINGSTTLTQTGPGPNGNGYVYWLNVNPGESYFIVIDRPAGDGGFEIQWTGTATVGDGAFPAPPTVNEIEDVKQCSSNPNVAVFDLNSLGPSINSDPGNTIEYYESLADAIDDINELPGIYANTTNPQTIYAKVKSGGTDCYSIVDFDLVVTPIPVATIAASDTAICEGEEVTFTITGTPDATVHYNINNGTTETILLDGTGTASFLQSPTANITVNLEDAQILNANNTVVCSQILNESTSVTVNSNTTPSVVNNSPICENEDGELQFSGDPNATIAYTINGGAEQTFNLDATGNYTLSLPSLTTDTDIELISVTSALPPNCVLTLNTLETIVVNPMPTVIDPSPLLACNDGVNPNVAPFDLDAQSAAISNNEPNVSVSYYETQLLAENGDLTDALASPYNSTSANQIIYVRVETDLGCVDYTTLNLQVIGAPIANVATDLQSCGPNGTGIGTFDLTQAEPEIVAGNTQAVQVSYFVLEAEAEAGTPSIPDPTAFDNTMAYNQTIYVRVDSDVTDCYTIAPLNVEVFDTPDIQTPEPLETCDDVGNDGLAQFNLDSQTASILNGASGITVTYHVSLTDAENDNAPLTSPYLNTGNNQTIYVRAENDLNTNCIATTSFNLIVNPLPTLIAPTALVVCDDNTSDGITEIDLSIKNGEITGGNPNYSVAYYASLFDAENQNGALPLLYTNTSNPQTIFVNVTDTTTGCSTITTLELEVEQAPVAFSPTPLELCDPDSDGFGEFDLTSKDDEITGGDATLTVTYHETLADAENNVNPVSSPYSNIVNNVQTLHARVESTIIATDCETIVQLQLIVNPTPQLGATPLSPLEICDDSSADGFGQFDLTTKIPEILQNLNDPTLYSVSFYINETDADDGIGPIANPLNYTNNNAFSQIIWVRVEDNTTGCYKLTTLQLIVNALPVLVQPNPLELCDINNPGDEVEAFTLDDAADEILNNQSGIGLMFFETQVDLDNNSNPITSPYTNLTNPQTVFVKATNSITGCSSSTVLTLRVRPIPSPAAPMDLEVCDDDLDGFTEFDLEERTTEIIGGEPNVEITYHETLEDANTGSNALESPYTNIVINQQTLYVRATNTVTGCYTATRTLTLRVLAIPQVPTNLEPYTICDTDANGFAPFDLTTKDSEIIGNQTDVSLTYHVSETDAMTGNFPISNPWSYVNASNPQPIYVRLENDNNICYDIGTFDINVALPPDAIQPTPLELCDDEIADETTVFDLTVKNDEITGGEASWSVSYYETLANAQNEIDAVNAEAYTNTSVNGAEANPQTLVAVVTDTDTGCKDMVTLTIRVMNNPTPTTILPDAELCDDNNAGDLVETFDLTANENVVFNGEVNVSATYYETLDNAENDIDAIADPTAYNNTSSPQTIYIRVSNNTTGCFTIVNFNLVVNPLPETTAIPNFIACEVNTDQSYDFDLTTRNQEVLNGQDSNLFSVTYHTSQADADNLNNALVSPYTNTSNPQEIFVAITNVETGCSVSTQKFFIEVQEGALANSDGVDIVYELCYEVLDVDNDPTNNTVVFDLSTVDSMVLDGQDPTNYMVSYYATEEDATLGVNPLETEYENVVNPQIIWARVDNDTLDGTGMDTSSCYALAPVTLRVNSLPYFELDDAYVLCLNTNGTEALDPLVIDIGLSTLDYTFQWSYEGVELPGETGSSLMPTEGGNYSVTVTDISSSDQTNCSITQDTQVTASEPPNTLEVNVVTQTFSGNNTIEAVAGGPSTYEYSLDNGPWQSSGTFNNVSAGIHEVMAREIEGCGYLIRTIPVIDYPLYFTPNGDGKNETWNIEGIGEDAKIFIFDRYGKLLKQISPEGNGWDGNYNGNALPTDDYWFRIEYTEPLTGARKEFTANFTLKR